MKTEIPIASEDRTWAVVAHLSCLAGYLIPLGGVIAPIAIYLVKSERPVVRAIAKQALILNVAVFLSAVPIFLMFLTIVLIPGAWLAALAVAAAALFLPIIGAVMAFDGRYFRYPLVGGTPRF